MSDVMYYPQVDGITPSVVSCERTCEDCEHFRITVEPYTDLNMGVAECTEHGLVKDFISHRELKYLEPCEQFKERERNEN